MKAYEDKKLLKYILKYVSSGHTLGYFNDTQSEIIYRKLSNLDIYFDSHLKNCLKIDKDCLIFNSYKLDDENNKENYFEAFKEFTSFINELHRGVKENNSIDNPNIFLKLNIKTIMLEYFNLQFDASYKVDNKVYSPSDINNPYLYFMYGFNFLNEVVSQMIATNMANNIFKLRNKKKKQVRNYMYTQAEYVSSFEYCGIGEEFIDSVSKNIFELKNTTNLYKAIFKTNFLDNFFKDILNDEEKLLKTFKLLSYFGVLYYCEEIYFGKKFNKVQIDKKIVRKIYKEINNVLSNKLSDDEIKKSR